MIIHKTLTLETADDGFIIIQVSSNGEEVAKELATETIWPKILKTIVGTSSSLTITEW